MRRKKRPSPPHQHHPRGGYATEAGYELNDQQLNVEDGRPVELRMNLVVNPTNAAAQPSKTGNGRPANRMCDPNTAAQKYLTFIIIILMLILMLMLIILMLIIVIILIIIVIADMNIFLAL
jgi:hypothetical protein